MLVAASVNGNGAGGNGSVINFTAQQQLQRPALTLLNGELYVAYAGYADTDPYTAGSWASTLRHFQLNKVLNTHPNDGADRTKVKPAFGNRATASRPTEHISM